MHPMYQEFAESLARKDKERCVELALSKLSRGEIDVVTLYNDVLAPALNAPAYGDAEGAVRVWEEHARTSIVRTVVENCYPFVAKERKSKYGAASARNQHAVVVCPTEEFHEIGARMVADFFDLCGYSVTFVGANTPQDDIIEAIAHVKPAFVAVSVTNTYSLVAAKRTVEKVLTLREREKAGFKVIVGGSAFLHNPGMAREMGADLLLSTFEDIRKLSEAG